MPFQRVMWLVNWCVLYWVRLFSLCSAFLSYLWLLCIPHVHISLSTVALVQLIVRWSSWWDFTGELLTVLGGKNVTANSSEIMNIGDIIQTEHVVVMYLGIYSYAHMYMKDNRKYKRGCLKVGKGRDEWYNYNKISKTKEKGNKGKWMIQKWRTYTYANTHVHLNTHHMHAHRK